jgi:DNA-binding transcriptional LysR family regulator
MELRQLEYFIVLCEELHFTKAAERLGISQPNLSQQIRILEGELGTPLFDRIGKRIALTEAGRLLQEQSGQIFTKLHFIEDAIAELSNIQRGKLTIGVLPSDLDYRMTEFIVEFHRQYPNIFLTVIGSVEILKQVLDNEMDIGITILPEFNDKITAIPLYREEYVLVVSETHPWATRSSVRLEEIQHISNVTFPKGYLGRELIDNYCKQCGFALDPIIETTTVFSLLNLVDENIGGTVLPKKLVDLFHHRRLKFIQITNPTPVRELGIVYRNDRFLSQTAKAVIQKSIEYFKE